MMVNDRNMQVIRSRAMTCLNNGNLREAGRLFHEICRSKYNDADSWFMLGAIQGQLGDFKAAEAACRRVIALQPGAFAAWDNLGIALMLQGRNTEAEPCFRRALEINPSHAGAYNNLGNLLHNSGQLQTALVNFEKAILLNPSYAEAYNNQGLVLREMGNIREAEQCFTRAIQINPGYADAHHNLGDARRLSADLGGALHHYRKALQLNPRLAETQFSMGSLMEELNRKEEALVCYARTLEIAPNFTRAIVGSARLTAARGQPDLARAQIERALESSPENQDLLAELANLESLAGKYQHAYQILRPCIDTSTDNINVALAYASISRHAGSQVEARAGLERFIEKTALPVSALEEAYFALGKLNEALGDFDRAFEHYESANTACSRGTDLERHLQEIHSIRNFFSPEMLATVPRADNTSKRPVFIVGMPRSGTSLVEQILAAHPLVHGGGELTELWKIINTLPDDTGTGEPYPACLQQATQAQLNRSAMKYLEFTAGLDKFAHRVTDKLPHNFLHLGLIQMLFPCARIIHCIRDPRDTCLSIYSHKFNMNHLYAHSLEELGKYYLGYQRLMQHWHSVLQIPILDIRYENLVQSPETGSRDLVAFSELPWDDRCLRFHESGRIVYTPSRDQVRQPVYTSAIGRWRQFEKYLGPLLRSLEMEDRQS
jgi:tetratricopeptide (TPR) repeat protein